MGFETFILQKKAEKAANDERIEVRRAIVGSTLRIFDAVPEASDDRSERKKWYEARSVEIEIEEEVKAFLRQTPHNDRSGVKYYALIFNFGGQLSEYARFNQHTPVKYEDESATELSTLIAADKEVLELVSRIEAAQLEN